MPVAEGRERMGGGWVGEIQGQGCRRDGRFPAGFTRNTWVMLPIRFVRLSFKRRIIAVRVAVAVVFFALSGAPA
jgi:hypothetical protein